MMIRIRYTFQSVENGIKWNDFLSSKELVSDALAEFAKIGPRYMLENLVDMRLFTVVNCSLTPTGNQIHGIENQIHGIDSDIAYFISKHKAMIHYGLTREEFASKLGKHPSCFDDRLRPTCSNGSFHAAVTRDKEKVTCPECLKRIK